MGAAAPSAEVIDRAATRSGRIAVTGRYHRLPVKIEDVYEIDKGTVLGSGYNGQVHLARSRSSGEGQADKFAVKGFKLAGASKEKMEELWSECEIFLAMDHPHVARLVDVFETDSKITLVMECIEGGEVFKRVQARKRYTEGDAATAVYQMLLAINYIHSHGVAHRDIKLENFLYESKESDHLRLIDFGFSKVFKPNTLMHLSCGTLSYVAPEVLEHNYTQQCDLWSLGVVTFILLFGYMPFGGGESVQVQKIKTGNYTVKQDRWDKVSPIGQDFVKKLLVVKPNERLTAKTALAHAFLKKRTEDNESHLDQGIVDSLTSFGQASAFRRAALHMMAWSLSNEERAQVRDAFIEMDTDRSGAITLGEFKKVLHDHFHVEETEAEAAFHALDQNHDDEIHYSEFLAAMVSTRIRVHDDLMKQAFRRFDADASGFIDKNDLKQLVGESFEGVDLSQVIKAADTDHDGKVSYEEWIAYVLHTREEEQHHAAGAIIDQEISRGECSCYRPLMRRKKTGEGAPAVVPEAEATNGIDLVEKNGKGPAGPASTGNGGKTKKENVPSCCSVL
jgi:calcium-dependent protein kinase